MSIHLFFFSPRSSESLLGPVSLALKVLDMGAEGLEGHIIVITQKELRMHGGCRGLSKEVSKCQTIFVFPGRLPQFFSKSLSGHITDDSGKDRL